eukprot:SAG31_NODE_360_length_17025_cov_5.362460_11_plen_34_part_00
MDNISPRITRSYKYLVRSTRYFDDTGIEYAVFS